MKFTPIFVSSRSVTIECDSPGCYLSTMAYNVYLNGNLIASDVHTNVYSLYHLFPNTTYSLRIEETISSKSYSGTIKTLKESVLLNVRRFGAKGDGINDDTKAIQAAIMSAPKDSVVYFPKGTYLSCPLFLKSDISLYLDYEATLLGSINREDYPILPGVSFLTNEKDDYILGTWEGNPLDTYASLLTLINVKNVLIYGQGTIDGNASNSVWWENRKEKVLGWRPRLIFMNKSANVSLSGLNITNSPSWTIHPFFSNNLAFIDLKISNPKDSPNTDGLDPESCSDVNIIGVHFSVGDDCIAIKSGKIFLGSRYNTPSQNITIRNCSMNHGHGAVVIGSEMSGGVRNVSVNQCLFNETDRGLRIKTRRGRGKNAIVDEIVFENIVMNEVLTPLVMNMFYYCDPDGKTKYVSEKGYPLDDRTPYLGHFSFKNIFCNDISYAAGVFYGLREAPIGRIDIENITFHFKKNATPGLPAMRENIEPMCFKGLIFSCVKEVNVSKISFDGLSDEELVLDEVDNFYRK